LKINNKIYFSNLNKAIELGMASFNVDQILVRFVGTGDLMLNGVVNSKFSIDYDGTNCSLAGNGWTSNAVYFNDTKSALGVGASIFQNTMSVNIHLNKLTIIPELRLESASDKVFLNSSNIASTGAGNFLIAAVYKF
jgi:hypothetical protein